MDPLELKKLLDDNLSIRQIAKKMDKSFTATLYWVNKYGLKSKHEQFNEKDYGTHRVCPRCKCSLPLENFYNRRDKTGSGVYCKKCTSDQTLERVRKFKSDMVEYKGGKCVVCGYDKYQGALEFHHLDPTKKDFNLSKVKVNRFDDRIKDELDKCILVCSNCHREIHNDIQLGLNVVLSGIEPEITV